MKNINLSNKGCAILEDNGKTYFAVWIHEKQKLIFKEFTNPMEKGSLSPNFTFENGMNVIVNSGIDYYENIYSLSRDEIGKIKPTLIAIGLFCQGLKKYD